MENTLYLDVTLNYLKLRLYCYCWQFKSSINKIDKVWFKKNPTSVMFIINDDSIKVKKLLSLHDAALICYSHHICVARKSNYNKSWTKK